MGYLSKKRFLIFRNFQIFHVFLQQLYQLAHFCPLKPDPFQFQLIQIFKISENPHFEVILIIILLVLVRFLNLQVDQARHLQIQITPIVFVFTHKNSIKLIHYINYVRINMHKIQTVYLSKS